MSPQCQVADPPARLSTSDLTTRSRISSSRLGGLPSPTEAEGIWNDLWYQEAHHSTALEGNTLVLKQVRALLDEGRAVGDKELREYLEVSGYAAAARWVYGQALEPGDWATGSLVSIQEVRRVHHMTLTPVWQVAPHPEALAGEGPGSWREHDLLPFSAGMQPPLHPLVDAQMNGWIELADSLRGAMDEPLPERLARVHNGFERIHPFLDGNGRAGRLLLNLLLVRLGYPPAIIYKNQRTAYLSALQKADADDFGPLGELLARAITDNLHRFVVPAVAGPARLVPLESLANPGIGITHNALRVAAHRGRLKAQKQPDGTWMSSQRWLDEYRETRYVRKRSERG